MLLRSYRDSDIVARIVENVEAAPIPEMHKRVFRFARRFTQRSWETRESDIQALREAGLPDSEIALWASRAAGQTWFVMSADGGGVALDVALSLRDETLHRNDLALKLLDRPQSAALDARRHAMVRARVSALNQCTYSRTTTRALLEQASGDADLWQRVTADEPRFEDPADQRVVELATRLARSAYKVTARDAEGLRQAGLTDEAYVEVLNTTALQTSLDRLANTLGVVPDEQPVLAA